MTSLIAAMFLLKDKTRGNDSEGKRVNQPRKVIGFSWRDLDAAGHLIVPWGLHQTI